MNRIQHTERIIESVDKYVEIFEDKINVGQDLLKQINSSFLHFLKTTNK